MSPSTRRETISCSPWWRSAWVSRVEISSGCCIINPFMVLPSVYRVWGAIRPGLRRDAAVAAADRFGRGSRSALQVGFVAARWHARRRSAASRAEDRHGGERRLEAPCVRQHAGDEGSGGQAEQVLEQRQHRAAGGADAGVDHVDHDGRDRADGAGHQEAAERDESELALRRRVRSRSAARRRPTPARTSARCTAAPVSRELGTRAGARRRDRPPRPRPRCRRRRTARPALP